MEKMRARTFPEPVPDISTAAAVLADSSRAAMCAALMDGRAWTAGELGRYCGLARSTASEHANLLVARGFAEEIRQGRHRYLRLAGECIARIIEDLAVVSGTTVATPPSLGAHRAGDRLRAGRTCYRPLAGRLGVGLAAQLQHRGLMDDDFQPTAGGLDLLASWGIPETARGIACLDATERRFHLAGPLGVSICQAFFAQGWVERIADTRAVRLTPGGVVGLAGAGISLRLPCGPGLSEGAGQHHVLDHVQNDQRNSQQSDRVDRRDLRRQEEQDQDRSRH